MGVYVNAASADRVMFGVTEEMNERWRGASACKVSRLTGRTEYCANREVFVMGSPLSLG
jgi:hypothetical protein